MLFRFTKHSFPIRPRSLQAWLSRIPAENHRSKSASIPDCRGSYHTRRQVCISIPSLASAILLIGLAALLLFVVGPLAGSVDDDGDGSPDIPVVVSDPILFSDLSADRGVEQGSSGVHDAAPSGHLGSSTPDIRVIESQLLSVNARSVLHSCCSLRC